MEVTVVQETPWSRALDAARRTIGKEPLHKEPSNTWKAKVLLAEHSPIKLVEYCIHFKNLRQWVGVHLLRHEHMLPFIHTQREDRRKLNCSRDELPQGSENDQDFVVNAQTLINISRKRHVDVHLKKHKKHGELLNLRLPSKMRLWLIRWFPTVYIVVFVESLIVVVMLIQKLTKKS